MERRPLSSFSSSVSSASSLTFLRLLKESGGNTTEEKAGEVGGRYGCRWMKHCKRKAVQ